MDGSVYLRLSDLEKLVSDLKKDRLDIVELYVENPDPEDPESADALFVSGVNPDDPEFAFEDSFGSDDSLADFF